MIYLGKQSGVKNRRICIVAKDFHGAWREEYRRGSVFAELIITVPTQDPKPVIRVTSERAGSR